MRKSPFLVAFKNVRGVGLKQHPCRYCLSYIVILSLVMIACALCINGFDIGMSHNQSDLFWFTFNISLESLIILTSFLSKIDIQSFSKI